MANLLGGDTIHHAWGIPIRKKIGSGDVAIKQQKDVAEKCTRNGPGAYRV